MKGKLKSQFISKCEKEIEATIQLFLDWPPSNYSILIALILLAATAVTMAQGDDRRAQELVIYSYYFLVLGVTIRFFEFALPENTQKKFGLIKIRISNYLNQPDYISFNFPDMDETRRWLFSRTPRLYWAVHEINERILGYMKKMTVVLTTMTDGITRLLYVRVPRFYWGITELRLRISGHRQFGKNIALVSDISMNIAIFLSVFLLISLVYGKLIDWWFVQRYLWNLVLIILALLGLRIVGRLLVLQLTYALTISLL